MDISKKGRLLFGLVILFSITFFMGTKESTGCFDCDTDNNGSIIMVNNSFTAYRFIITGPTEVTQIVSGQSSQTVWVEPGVYTVYSWGNPPMYTTLGNTWNFTMDAAGSKTLEQH